MMACFIGIPLNPLKLFDPSPHAGSFKDLGTVGYRSISGDKNRPVCFQGSDTETALAAASGYRVYYAKDKSDSLSISKRFGKPTQMDMDIINRSCQ
jgi:hypothetical protein